MKELRVLAPAKINLALEITGIREDGYHLLETVMLAVSLCDMLAMELRTGGEIAVSCDLPGVPVGADNLAHRAALGFFAHTGLSCPGLAIHINKNIPMQAGLAGGSADAAAVLVGLDALLQTGLSSEVLEGIALTLGADVPFCVRGGCALATGVGERMNPLPVPGNACLLLAKPPEGMDTAAAFRRFDDLEGAVPRPDLPGLCAALEAGDLPGIAAAMGNVLEAACDIAAVADIKAAMMARGALGAAMTGSGTAVAGLFPGQEEARACAAALAGGPNTCFLVGPLSHGAIVLDR